MPHELEVVRAAPLTAPVIRAKSDPADARLATMEVAFSRFAEWYEIDSFWEGRFLERTERGAFAKTIKENRDRIKVQFDHGYDPSIGTKLLGTIDDLTEEKSSPLGVVALFDTSYNRDLLPGLDAGVYGSSMRMVVIKDEWNEEPGRSDYNPDGIPERTIKEVRLLEFGPVTWPANPSSTAGTRSGTDYYYERLQASRPAAFEELTRSHKPRTPHLTEAGSTTSEADGAARTTPAEPVEDHSGGLTPAQRRERLTNHLRGESDDSR